MKYYRQFLFGGLAYFTVETIFRKIVNHRPPHLIMFIVGGLACIMIYAIENNLKVNLVIKAILSGIGITFMELCVGCFFKFVLNDILWQYSGLNLFGVISLHWTLLWCGLSLLVILLYRVFKKLIKH